MCTWAQLTMELKGKRRKWPITTGLEQREAAMPLWWRHHIDSFGYFPNWYISITIDYRFIYWLRLVELCFNSSTENYKLNCKLSWIFWLYVSSSNDIIIQNGPLIIWMNYVVLLKLLVTCISWHYGNSYSVDLDAFIYLNSSVQWFYSTCARVYIIFSTKEWIDVHFTFLKAVVSVTKITVNCLVTPRQIT